MALLHNSLVDFFYHIKPLIPRRLQLTLRRYLISSKMAAYSDTWPIDPGASTQPANWPGWPDGRKFALVLVHDVDTEKGYRHCSQLMKIEQDLGFHSIFNFVPERCYTLTEQLRNHLATNAFEIGVHDLRHDGKLFQSEKIFNERAKKINAYLREWNSEGFRSGAMHSNLEWISRLDIKHDSSTFDTDPFEPKPSGQRTIFPFWVKTSNGKQYVELPYTLPQDFTLFVLMKEKTIDIWKKKLDWVAHHGGMALVTTHPDYMNFDKSKLGSEEYPSEFYAEFLKHIRTEYNGQYWNALPKDIASFWAENIDTKIARDARN